jgi:septal ring factor EnvC (AmiA/AmiB activator)
VAIVAAAMLVSGCELGPFPQISWAPVKPKKPEPTKEAEKPAAKYLEQTSLKGELGASDNGAVGEAMAWMERYTKEVERRTQVEKENRTLEDQNRQLSSKVGQLQADLSRAQQELDEANAMMLRLDSDLKAWKKDVLGYRDETRAAHKETMRALGRVLQLLGGELPSGALASTPTAASSSRVGTPPKAPTPAQKESGNASTGS